MPEISRFYGIIISMYYREHGVPHFHARYGEYRSAFSIVELEKLEGQLPRRVQFLVLEWAFEHRQELLDDWELAQAGQPLRPISPLD